MPKITQLVEIPKIIDDCLLYFAQSPEQISFPIKRIYFISQAKPGLPRGFHAHKKTEQILFCIKGKIKMILDNGKKREEIILDKPNVGIALPRMMWHEMHDFEPETILLILASQKFNPKDYIRNYEDFLKRVESK